VPADASSIIGQRNSVWKGRTYPIEVIELNMGLNNPDKALTNTQKRALAHLTQSGGIYFNRCGFPDFEPFAYQSNPSKYTVDLESAYTGSCKDFALANKKIGLKKTPLGYTWHHIPASSQLILVDRYVHSKIGHTGGVATAQEKIASSLSLT